MAVTTITTSDSSTVSKWLKDTMKEAFWKTFWGRFMTSGSEGPVYLRTDFEKEQGDTVKFDMFPRPSGDPFITDGNYEGNLQKLSKYQETVTLKEVGIGVQYRGEIDKQRPAWDIGKIHKERLTGQVGEMIDWECFNSMYASTFTKVFRPNGRANDAALVAGDTIDPDTLIKAATWASTGGHGTQPPVEPIMVDGRECFIYLTYPDGLRDFFRHPEYQQWQREAEVRGKTNPLFKNSKMVISSGACDIVIHSHRRVERTTNASSVKYLKSMLLGKHALSFAMCKKPKLIVRDFNFGTQVGMLFLSIFGSTRTQFNSLDWGTVGIHAAYTDTNA